MGSGGPISTSDQKVASVLLLMVIILLVLFLSRIRPFFRIDIVWILWRLISLVKINLEKNNIYLQVVDKKVLVKMIVKYKNHFTDGIPNTIVKTGSFKIRLNDHTKFVVLYHVSSLTGKQAVEYLRNITKYIGRSQSYNI